MNAEKLAVFVALVVFAGGVIGLLLRAASRNVLPPVVPAT
jgi:hypothetical protein